MDNFKCIENSQSLLGECPLYNEKEDALYWTDIKKNTLKSYDLKTKDVKTYNFSRPIGSFAFTNNNKIIATTDNGFEYLDLKTNIHTQIVNPEYDVPNNRFNDGKCDAFGRYLAGTMDKDEEKELGSLYSLDKDQIKKLEKNLFISNGLGWNVDSTKFYLTDSPKRVIYVYDYDLGNGTLSNRKIFTNINEKDGFPDGLCVDSENYIWSAHWYGWKITRYAPDGSIDMIYNLPVPKVTSCNFGGKNLDTLFITTARFGLNEDELKQAPLSGCLFSLKTNVHGQKNNFFKIK